ncbi:MAG: GTP-binding protein [Acetatifactor sp.]|nr:GTP-binding protein [Acetatifactor sp.]
MTRIDVVSGFLGAGKTTLIKKLLKEAIDGNKTVLIENEFGEIGIDGGFLKEAGIEIKEMNSGCICCSLVGDFGESLKEVVKTYAPERILIEPSGVGKLSDVLNAIENVAKDMDVEINSAVAVVDATKAKMYIKNFGEFFINQIEYAGTIILSRTAKMNEDKLKEVVAMIREHNANATIITTDWDELDGKVILEAIEGNDKLGDMMEELLERARAEHEADEAEHEHCHHHHHDDDDDDDDHCCHHHHHDDDDDDEHCHHHHHDDDDDDDDHCCHHHHHDDDDDDDHCCHHHHHDDDDDDDDHCCHHHHHDDDDDDDHCCHHHDHDHDHDHEHHHHHHHHADEVFTSWGVETATKFTVDEIEKILTELDTGKYGVIVRSKGMVPSEDGTWIYFDYVPEEHDIRKGSAEVTGKLVVIGAELKEDEVAKLFRQ